MRLIETRPKFALLGGPIAAGLITTLLVLLMEDDSVLSHWPEILGVSAGTHVVLRWRRKPPAPRGSG